MQPVDEVAFVRRECIPARIEVDQTRVVALSEASILRVVPA
jgi:hypothetical protein